MGQQQLLLLVLATVIVGLATVAGIEAFDQNQAQASQDALTQKGIEIATDIKAADEKPTQFGGVDVTGSNPNATAVAQAIGLSSKSVSVDGGGTNATCEIKNASSNEITVECKSDDSQQDVTVKYDPDGSPQVSTSFTTP